MNRYCVNKIIDNDDDADDNDDGDGDDDDDGDDGDEKILNLSFVLRNLMLSKN